MPELPVPDPLSPGEALLPEEELPGPQPIAVCELLVPVDAVPLEPLGLALLPVVLSQLGLVVGLAEVPDPLVELLLPLFRLGLVPVLPPGALLVCAMAAVPNAKTKIEAVVRRRRFMRVLLEKKTASPSDALPQTASRDRRSDLSGKWSGFSGSPIGAPVERRAKKQKGRTKVRPKFREEKPEGLAIRSGDPARTARSS